MESRSTLDIAVEAVAAGLAVARAHIGAVSVTLKQGVDVVTDADISAEDAIRAVLAERCPELAVVGEERGGVADTGAAPYWLIDPICGTRNYASQLPAYCTNLALVQHGVVEIGVVGDGANGQVYAAERGRGAWLATAPARTALHARDGSVIALDLRGKPPFTGSTEAVGRIVAQLIGDGRYHLRLLGTTLPFAKLATGDFAAALLLANEPGDPLHTAAGCALAEASGAIVTDEWGKPWTLGSTMLIAAATRELHAFLVELVARHFRLAE